MQRFLELTNYYRRWKDVRRVEEEVHGETSFDNTRPK